MQIAHRSSSPWQFGVKSLKQTKEVILTAHSVHKAALQLESFHPINAKLGQYSNELKKEKAI